MAGKWMSFVYRLSVGISIVTCWVYYEFKVLPMTALSGFRPAQVAFSYRTTTALRAKNISRQYMSGLNRIPSNSKSSGNTIWMLLSYPMGNIKCVILRVGQWEMPTLDLASGIRFKLSNCVLNPVVKPHCPVWTWRRYTCGDHPVGSFG